jgi:hypothetical protein
MTNDHCAMCLPLLLEMILFLHFVLPMLLLLLLLLLLLILSVDCLDML